MSSPLAQSFFVSPDAVNNQAGMFVTALDLYFQASDPLFGITVELRTTENGYPTNVVIPFGRAHLPTSSINTSTIANSATTFNFPGPVYLTANTSYCFCVIADGNSPDYLIYTAETGQTDVTNSSYTVRSDWGSGTLFSSTGGAAWQSIQGEYIKFNLYNANFTTTTGTATLVNSDDEFLGYSNTIGSFIVGENVFKFSNTPIAGQVSFQNSSNIITGSGTTFQNLITNSYLILTSTYIPTPGSYFDIVKVQSISNNTYLTLDRNPKFTATAVSAILTPTGQVTSFNTTANTLFLTNSTAANGSFLFAANDTVIGITSGAVAQINQIQNLDINYFQPILYRTTVLGTNFTATQTLTDNTYATRDTIPIVLNQNNYLNKYDVVVCSKSNEITANIGKSVKIPISLSTTSSYVTPSLSVVQPGIIGYSNIINADNTGESSSSGNTINRYISKIITLEDGMDAEDIRVYLNSYEPTGTDIEVYVRVLNELDSSNLNTKTWTLLQRIAPIVKSDPTNINDFKNFNYQFLTLPPGYLIPGIISGTANTNTITGVSSYFSANTAAGQTAVIFDTAGDLFVTQVANVASNTSLTLLDNLPWSLSGGSIGIFNDAGAIYLDPQNNGIASYYSNGTKYSSYKTFEFKILLLSNQTYIVPRVDSIQGIAISV